MAIITADESKLGRAICDALGVEYCTKITLVLEVNSLATVTVEQHVTEDQDGKLAAVIKQYNFVEQQAGTNQPTA